MRYRALLFANWEYDSVKLPPLKGPKQDVELMRKALMHEQYGLFEEQNIEIAPPNLKWAEIGRTIEAFLTNSEKDDYLLIYYSGHGGLTYDNYLALCGVDTVSFDATAWDTRTLPGWVKTKGRGCPTVVVLDCCFAGQVGGKGANTAARLTQDNLVDADGLFVLASSGRTTSPDAPTVDLPSPFTAALAKVLEDPEIRGETPGFLMGQEVYSRLCRMLQDPEPRWKGQGNLFPLARRVRPTEAAEVPGWPAQQLVETINISISTEELRAAWSTDNNTFRAMATFDQQRRWAIRRLTDLADGVLRQREVDAESLAAVRKAWECIGGNLFMSALPETLQQRIRQPGSPKQSLLRLRLFFPDGKFEDYPWEYLHDDAADVDDDDRPRTLGRRPGILVERAAPAGEPRSYANRVWDVLTINTYIEELAEAGGRVHADLSSLFGAQHAKYVSGIEGNWSEVMDLVENNESKYLVLIAPLVRTRDEPEKPKSVRIAFRHSMNADFRSASAFATRIREAKRVFKCILLITYAAEPGRDSYRSVLTLAGLMAKACLGPVAFVCHERAYLKYLSDERGARTFPGLLIRALELDKNISQAFAWGRDRIIESAGTPGFSFGVPGLYAPVEEEAAATPGASSSGLRQPMSVTTISRDRKAARP
jgi:hypothetical protein